MFNSYEMELFSVHDSNLSVQLACFGSTPGGIVKVINLGREIFYNKAYLPDMVQKIRKLQL
jgi:hypothetical protein